MRGLRPRWAVSSLFGLVAVLALSVLAAIPAQAASNATLGDLNAATPSANKYAGCVASVLTGSGVTFGSAASLGAELAAVWSTLPAAVADACKKAVDTHQPQVCVNPADPTTCPAIGAANAAALVDQALSFPGTWKLVNDGIGLGGYAQTPLPTSGPSTATAVVTGTFTTPVGMVTDFGVPVTAMTVSIQGRTPNAENGVKGHVHLVDGLGNVADASDVFGNSFWGYGCGPGDCTFNSRVTWNCKDFSGAAANCGGQTLTVSFTFESGVGGGCGNCVSPAPSLGQFVEFQLGATNLSLHLNPNVCPLDNDCMRYGDSRLSYLDGNSRPTAVQHLGATTPSAVINLSSSSLGCLVGADVTSGPAISCTDVTGAFAPLVQTAHALVVPAPPPTVAAVVSPAAASGGWVLSPVTVSITASDDKGPGIKTVYYSAAGAENLPETAVPGSTAKVVLTVDGTTTVTTWADDMAGTPSAWLSLTVKIDHTAPSISCAAHSTAWSAGNVTVACTVSDSMSGLADTTQAQLSLTTSVAAGAESASAATNSVNVCDLAGNCATAGPITGIKVDRLAPAISITAPAGTYSVGQLVKAAYTCTDGGSGVATCITQPSGSAIDTAAVGPHTFTVDATDVAGNHSKLAVNYTVTAAPAPPPVCTDSENGNHAGNHENGCEKHGVAVRPVTTPKPTPQPKPEPTFKPTTHGGNDQSGGQKDQSGDQKDH